MEGYVFVNRAIDPKLVKRLTLSDNPDVQNPYLLPRMIYPVTDIGDLLRTTKGNTETVDLTGAAGSFVTHASWLVPNGKRWRLWNCLRGASTGSSRIMLTTTGLTDGSLEPFGTAESLLQLGGLPINEGDMLGLRATGNGADGAIRLTIVYEEEDAFE